MYEDIYTGYNSAYKGLKLIGTSNAQFGADYPKLLSTGQYSVVTANYGTTDIVEMTGRYLVMNTDVAYQIIYGNKYGYFLQSNAGYWNKYSDNSSTGTYSSATNYLNELIGYNQAILENNLLCARAIEYMTNNGGVVPVDYRKQLYALQTRLMKRNQQIIDSGYLSESESAESPNLSIYNDALNNFMNNPGISGIGNPVAIVIIVLGVISLVSSYVAYVLFKKLNTEAKVDFGYSNSLNAKLLKYLPKDVYNDLMGENAYNAKTANNAISASKKQALWSSLKYAAVAFGTLFVVNKYKQTN